MFIRPFDNLLAVYYIDEQYYGDDTDTDIINEYIVSKYNDCNVINIPDQYLEVYVKYITYTLTDFYTHIIKLLDNGFNMKEYMNIFDYNEISITIFEDSISDPEVIKTNNNYYLIDHPKYILSHPNIEQVPFKSYFSHRKVLPGTYTIKLIRTYFLQNNDIHYDHSIRLSQ